MDILLTIKTRGPYAFQNLLNSLRETNHDEIADLLEFYDDEEAVEDTRKKTTTMSENEKNKGGYCERMRNFFV